MFKVSLCCCNDVSQRSVGEPIGGKSLKFLLVKFHLDLFFYSQEGVDLHFPSIPDRSSGTAAVQLGEYSGRFLPL